MNHFYLFMVALILAALNTKVNAQEPQMPLTFTEEFESSLSADFPLPATGFLYDRTFSYAHLDVIEECDTIDAVHVVQAWNEMERSGFNPDYSNLQNLRNELTVLQHSNQLGILGYDFRFEIIDQSLRESAQLYEEHDLLHCAEGTYPYELKSASGFAFTQDVVYTDRPCPVFIQSEMFINNTGSDIQRIRLDIPSYENTIYIFPGDTVFLNFTDEEDFIVDITTDLNDGRIVCTKSFVRTKTRLYKTDNPCEDGYLLMVESDIPFKGDLEQYATTSVADAHIFYHKTPGNECKIIKPVIIADGFDPLDTRDFINIKKTVDYNKSGNNTNLVDDLQNNGFDVIILNFPILGSEAINYRSEVKQYKDDGSFDRFVNHRGRDGGADYIQRNAFLTVKLIQMINAKLQENGSNEELIVIGPSMGGLITRYALSYMEKKHSDGVQNMNHNTKLWLSFDSPHDGANIPLSTQIFLDLEGGFYGNAQVEQMFKRRLRSPAARQMLVPIYESIWIEGNFETRNHFDIFHIDMLFNGLSGSKGWPQNVRRISVLNGNLKGVRNWPDAAIDIDIDFDKEIQLLFEKESVRAAEFQFNLSGKPGIKSKVGSFYRLAFGKEGLNKGEFIDEFPSEGRLTIHWKYNAVSYAHTYLMNIFYTNNDFRGNLDNVQGAMYPKVDEITDRIIDELNKQKQSSNDRVQVHASGSNFTFIPSVSAAGLKYAAIDWNTSFTGRDLVCEGLTYFDNVFIPESNEFHVQVTEQNAEWILKEITTGTQGCSRVCPDSDWPDILCKDETFTFHLNGTSSNNVSAITWNTDSKLNLVAGQNTYAASIKAIGSSKYDVNYTIDVDVSTTCGGDLHFKHLLEIPNTHLDVTGPTEICAPDEHYFAKGLSESSNHFWYFGDINGVYRNSTPYINVNEPTNTSDPTFSKRTFFGGTRVGNYILYVEADNVCGETMFGQLGVVIMPESYCRRQRKGNFESAETEVSIYPNPASNWWTVFTNTKSPILSYSLYGMNGQRVRSVDLDDPIVVLDIPAQDLPQGVYVLHIKTAEGVYVRRITRNLD